MLWVRGEKRWLTWSLGMLRRLKARVMMYDGEMKRLRDETWIHGEVWCESWMSVRTLVS
jgi:hypothetical protein